ncbi:hypothetical protein BLOT_007280 [Blomia tropicalis]|nr:hypothetical protein BLOT_007280 [Blomia tropicalis]
MHWKRSGINSSPIVPSRPKVIQVNSIKHESVHDGATLSPPPCGSCHTIGQNSDHESNGPDIDTLLPPFIAML